MSRTTSNRVLFALSLIGLAISGYLTLAHTNYLALGCFKNMPGCDVVAAHPSSRGFGISGLQAVPTAAFGLVMYLTLAGLSFARAARGDDEGSERLSRGMLAILTAAVLVNGYLIYLEAVVIQAWCVWCLGSSATVGVMFVVCCAERLSRRGGSSPERVEA